jgi:hypothetical protein
MGAPIVVNMERQARSSRALAALPINHEHNKNNRNSRRYNAENNSHNLLLFSFFLGFFAPLYLFGSAAFIL